VRYQPDFVSTTDEDPLVQVEIIGLRLASAPPATLTVGDWRGEAQSSSERLRFSVPRRSFASDATRAGLSTGLLALRRDGRLVTFEVPFLVLPDQAGSVAFVQKLRWQAPESTTLMSPEIVVRAPAGETRAVRRCFDPPAGWRFDKRQHREVIVERLGWLDDASDPTLNGGTVEFAEDEGPEQICLAVSASPGAKGARTATIGRFEATLTREQSHEKVMQSGLRALDWNEPLRLPIEVQATERKLHVRLFGEIVRELAEPLPNLAFLRIRREGDMLVLQADPSEP